MRCSVALSLREKEESDRVAEKREKGPVYCADNHIDDCNVAVSTVEIVLEPR
jgi:hypothetical protein